MILENFNIEASFFKKYGIDLSPEEILWGLDRNLVRPKAIVDYAADKFITYSEEDILHKIAILTKNERCTVRDILEQSLTDLTKGDRYVIAEPIANKWLYIVLKWTYDNKASFPDPLSIVEEIYAYFDYPEEIKCFVRYMPSTDVGWESREVTVEGNYKRLMERWLIYLKEKDIQFLIHS